jgi:hypothetical protein
MASWVRGVHQLTVQNREMLLPHEYSLLLIICGAVLLLFLINSGQQQMVSQSKRCRGLGMELQRIHLRYMLDNYKTPDWEVPTSYNKAGCVYQGRNRTFDLLFVGRCAKQPALPNRPRIAELAYVRYLQFAKARFQREHRQTTWCELGYGAWATRAKRAKKNQQMYSSVIVTVLI